MFDRGCGYTEFLVSMFHLLPWSDIQSCRLVSTKWRDFIQRYVVDSHPATLNLQRWRSGVPVLTSLSCGGEVRQITSDTRFVYCGMRAGVVLVFLSSSLQYVTALEEKESTIWQLEAGERVVVGVTEVCVLVWRKEDWGLVTRVKYWSEGQPYLHMEGDLMVVPGATKYTARVLLYHREEERVGRVRDLVHTKVWVVGAFIQKEMVVSLAIPACLAREWREVSVWDVRSGQVRHRIQVEGASGGFPALRYPHLLLPSASRGLEVWRLEEEAGKVRTELTGSDDRH